MDAETKESSNSNTLGVNAKAFFAKALPTGKSGHVLAVGEDHEMYDYTKTLKANMGALADAKGHNVGTLAMERPLHMNVVMWAMKDGHLPVSAGNEQAYLNSMMTANTMPGLKKSMVAAAEMVSEANRAGIAMVAFDARYTWASLTKQYGENMKRVRALLPEDTAAYERLHADPAALTAFTTEVRKHHKLSGYAVHTMLSLIEVEDLLEKHPQYKTKLEQMEAIALAAKGKGLGEDGQSAAVLAANMDMSRNAITISGHTHINGREATSSRAQGTFAAHLEEHGMTATPVILASQKEFVDWAIDGAPGGLSRRRMDEQCAARAPMHLVVLDRDVVLDVSNQEAIRQQQQKAQAESAAREVADDLVRRGTQLTCEKPDLPTTAQRAGEAGRGKQEVAK
jgi:hypothetical protein